MPLGLRCKTQSKVNPSEQKQQLLIFFHDTFIPILSLPSDRGAKVFYVEKLLLGGVSGHSKIPTSSGARMLLCWRCNNGNSMLE